MSMVCPLQAQALTLRSTFSPWEYRGKPYRVHELSHTSQGQAFCSLKEPTMDFRRVKDYFSWLYYQYQIISCCAVLEPWEQSMFNTILLTIVAMVVYTAYVFIPIHIRLAWEFFSKMCGYHSTLSN
ncbi:hypothetical protein QTO34_014737 [Cnephaeus nilssonii]|uniref:Serine palmitoyltransferase small subunit B n=1 Tax=Cnephaeus nilssonii TaxID=3371016 RepID=A0AA40I849_CNENI|nr:hypothetical protein QTO34_014737 [Eptesicus nilssonii]